MGADNGIRFLESFPLGAFMRASSIQARSIEIRRPFPRFQTCRYSWLRVAASALAIIWSAPGLHAQSPQLLDALHRIFATKEFEGQSFGPARWLEGGKAYATLERSAVTAEARDIIRYDTVSGKREVLVSAAMLVPADTK